MKPTERTIELRHALVSTVDAASFGRRRPRRRFTIAAIAAFALAGAATGGAVAAVAQSWGDPGSQEIRVSAEQIADWFAGSRATLVGDAFVVSGEGGTTLDLGTAPAEATAVSFWLECVDGGRFDLLVDGEWVMEMPCATDQGASGLGDVPFTHDHTAQITGTGRFVLWIAWSYVEQPVRSSEQTAALSDGVVTREEYLAGFQRFADCMADAGYPVEMIDTSGENVDYRLSNVSVGTGTDEDCYVPEFETLDIAWQTGEVPSP